MKTLLPGVAALSLLLAGCNSSKPPTASETPANMTTSINDRLNKYTPVSLSTDSGALTAKQREMIGHMIEAAKIVDGLFWLQASGPKDEMMAKAPGAGAKRFVEINYGPWDRLENNQPFIAGVGSKPAGANFYPADMTKDEFERAVASNPELKSLYTLVRRDNGKLAAVPFSQAYASELKQVADKLRQAAKLADNPGLKRYLELRADALLTDDYRASDLAWMDMKTNTVDLVIGPIESYEDKLFGYKASFEAYVLVKDREWSGRLEKYAAMLPALQKGLPVPPAYKSESPGTDSDLNAYDAIYYAGDCNAGSKTIAINLPNDEEVQLKKGTRRLQLKNVMRAKFEKIMVPISDQLMDPSQRGNVKFDAFFSNVMFHEVAHGLGVKNVLNSSTSVREALKEKYSALEEGKADILGLYLVTQLHKKGELGNADLLDNYATFLAGIFRSIRFGASSAHGIANVVCFRFFEEYGAFVRDPQSGTYAVAMEPMTKAVDALAERIIRLQGDGDYAAAAAFLDKYGKLTSTLNSDLLRLQSKQIPVDVVFEKQGL